MSFVKPFETHSELFGSFKVRLRKFSLVGLKPFRGILKNYTGSLKMLQ